MRRRRDRYDIFDEMRRIFNESIWNRFFPYEEPRSFLPSPAGRMLSPKPFADMIETDNEIIFTAEIPGVEKEDINLNITNDGIEVRIESKNEEETKGKEEYTYQSRYYGFRSFYSLPPNIDIDKAKATYKNGVLEVRIPKLKAEGRKRIKIE